MGRSYDSYGAAEVACPFYEGESFEKNLALIRCEGMYPGTVSTLSARSHQKLIEHKKRFCNSVKGCKDCPIYRTANEKYEGTD